MSLKCSINFTRVQDVSIHGSSSAVIQNLAVSTSFKVAPFAFETSGVRGQLALEIIGELLPDHRRTHRTDLSQGDPDVRIILGLMQKCLKAPDCVMCVLAV